MKASYIYIFVFVFVFYKTDSPLGITFTLQSLCQLSELVTSATLLSNCFQLCVLLPRPQTLPVREKLSLSLLPTTPGADQSSRANPQRCFFICHCCCCLYLLIFLLCYFRLGASSVHVQIRLLHNY